MCNRRVELPRQAIAVWLEAMPEAVRLQAEVFPLTDQLEWAHTAHYTLGYFLDQGGLNVMITPLPLKNLTCDSLRAAADASFPVGWNRLMAEQRWH